MGDNKLPFIAKRTGHKYRCGLLVGMAGRGAVKDVRRTTTQQQKPTSRETYKLPAAANDVQQGTQQVNLRSFRQQPS